MLSHLRNGFLRESILSGGGGLIWRGKGTNNGKGNESVKCKVL